AGILAHARDDDKKAVDLVRAAADLDATMDKHPATPSSVLPARELLADLLLELNQPAAALVEYRAMLSPDPNRFRSLLGEARAAKQTGDSATAHDAYRKLVALSTPDGSAPRTSGGQVLSNERKSPRVAVRHSTPVGWRTARARCLDGRVIQ